MSGSRALLSLSDLRLSVAGRAGGRLEILRGVSLDVPAGAFVGLVGETGSGKTLTLRSLLGMVEIPGAEIRGRAWFEPAGVDLLALSERGWNRVRGRQVALVPQNARASLNPVFRVGDQLAALYRLDEPLSASQARERAMADLRLVQIPAPERVLRAYPGELSGGLCQRVAIAMALARRPALLLADEPTTALDVTLQAEIMDLLTDLVRDTGCSCLLVTHDLGLVTAYCDQVLVMYAGTIMERGPVEALFSAPEHPYTQLLVDAATLEERPRVPAGSGSVSPAKAAGGCVFMPRCPVAQPVCAAQAPVEHASGDRSAACHFAFAKAASGR
jgi:peptide/nickel transport system ATP-binding protein